MTITAERIAELREYLYEYGMFMDEMDESDEAALTDIFSVLTDYAASEKAWDIKQRQLEEVTKERDALKAEVEHGRGTIGIMQDAMTYRDDVIREWSIRAEKAEAERDEWRDKAMFQQGRADEAMKIRQVTREWIKDTAIILECVHGRIDHMSQDLEARLMEIGVLVADGEGKGEK